MLPSNESEQGAGEDNEAYKDNAKPDDQQNEKSKKLNGVAPPEDTDKVSNTDSSELNDTMTEMEEMHRKSQYRAQFERRLSAMSGSSHEERRSSQGSSDHHQVHFEPRLREARRSIDSGQPVDHHYVSKTISDITHNNRRHSLTSSISSLHCIDPHRRGSHTSHQFANAAFEGDDKKESDTDSTESSADEKNDPEVKPAKIATLSSVEEGGKQPTEKQYTFSKKLQQYASTQWKSCLKNCLCVVSVFSTILVISLLTYFFVDNRTSIEDIPGVQIVASKDVISFDPSSASTYTEYVDHMATYLKDYSALSTVSLKSCTQKDPATKDAACMFDMNSLGTVCSKQNNYGYADARPCILLKVKQVKDWVPEPYEIIDVPTTVFDLFVKDSAIVRCEAQSTIGPAVYFPSSGVSIMYFPYTGQDIYQDPLLFVQFRDPLPQGEEVVVTCDLWSKDVEDEDRDRAAVSVTLKVL